MNTQDYEKEKAECWKDFWNEIISAIAFTSGAPDRMKEHIYDTFDRAYRLGMEAAKKQPLAERLTEEERKKVNAFYNGDTFGVLDFLEIISCRRVFESLFGKEFFNEAKQENNG